ncbi:hypothetical protein DN412_13095 [Cupriavidus lacunae]|uniref:Uncharacterized protein n=1 Tax=Cupriavidus lacunae TaxID=2666307 RepID=A0A370NW07_9BURK|nr:hypothetical protein DN412_13095 [Cupriavidus lacunae]
MSLGQKVTRPAGRNQAVKPTTTSTPTYITKLTSKKPQPNPRTKEPKNQRTKEPKNQRTKEPKNQRTKEPKNQRTKEPKNQRKTAGNPGRFSFNPLTNPLKQTPPDAPADQHGTNSAPSPPRPRG